MTDYDTSTSNTNLNDHHNHIIPFAHTPSTLCSHPINPLLTSHQPSSTTTITGITTNGDNDEIGKFFLSIFLRLIII
jgi:hypothetical protein